MSVHRSASAEASLRLWGAALRRAAARRRTCVAAVGLAAAACAAVVAPLAVPVRPRLVWNASASAPIGFYRITPAHDLRIGDWVVALPPQPVQALADRRRYLPLGVPLVKQVAGVAGDEICAVGPLIVRNGEPLVRRRVRDAAARLLPWWTGCETLARGQYLLVTRGVANSFDGRYFGPTESQDIIGRGVPLWTR